MRAALTHSTRQEVRIWDWERWRPALSGLYAQRAFVPLWFVGNHLTHAGEQLLDQLVGDTLFFDDIHQQDARLTRLLNGRASRSAAAG
jgi:hypothetical protein